MWDDQISDWDVPPEKEPVPSKTVKQSLLAIALALGLGASVILLIQFHYIVSEIGVLVWMAVTIVPSFLAAYQVGKMMAGYHNWARIIVAVIIFFSVAVFIAATLDAHHLGRHWTADDD
jgi:hypothetical protein